MRSAVLLSSLLLLAACGGYIPTFYKLDVRQGTIIEQERVQRLRTGMSRRQVEVLMGTPSIADPFNAERWDYVYIFYPRGNKKKGEQRHLKLFFTGDSLIRIEGDVEGLDMQGMAEEAETEDGTEKTDDAQ